MVEQTEKIEIDTDLYSRQIGTFGMETMGKLIKMKVLLVGMRGLGAEVAKNLILAGPASVDIYDPTPCQMRDLGANFYINEAAVANGLSRAAAALPQLAQLNGYVRVNEIKSLAVADHKNYNIVCYTENLTSLENLYEVNDFCRENKVGFILSETLGLFGYTFVDYGNKHIITDKDGEFCKQFVIAHISSEEKAWVTVHEDKRHSYQEGDTVVFNEVEGMTELNGHPPIKVIGVKGGFAFQLDLDTTKFGAYTRQGVVENVKVPFDISFQSLRQSYANPDKSSPDMMLPIVDLKLFGRSNVLHRALSGIHAFQQKHGRNPASAPDAEEVWAAAQAINNEAKEKENFFVDEFSAEEKIVKQCAQYAGSSLVPMTAFFGGIVAQEIVKLTGKYTPLRQWIHYDIFETLPEDVASLDRAPRNSRYDDQIAVFGAAFQEKMARVKTFMIGAGALGCELMKTFALMGLACSKEGSVVCTDNDNIEVSNLNRQFLFRPNNVKQSKSAVASEAGRVMNPALNVKAMQSFVAESTEDIFDDEFWENLDFVVNAVDNIKARLYVDQRCIWFEKPLLESGTLGTKANSQMVVPHKTLAYGDHQDPDDDAIPMCTIRNFPNLIEHCIEWSREQFNQLFVSRVQDAVSFLQEPQEFLKQGRSTSTDAAVLEQLRNVKEIVDLKVAANFQTLVQIARDQFEHYFNHSLRDFLALFPPDAKNSSGEPFWSGPKRCPSPIAFDPSNDDHLLFIESCANLIAFNLGMEQVRDKAQLKAFAQNTQAKEYIQKKIFVETPEEQKEREARGDPAPNTGPVGGENDAEELEKLAGELQAIRAQIKYQELQAVEFEKDDDKNFHIDFMHSSANMRARNYQITCSDRPKTKMIAGKIIPAIATTTAMITGCVAAEIYKHVHGWNDIEKFKNAFANLALPVFLFSEPDEIKRTKSKYDPIMGGECKAIPEGFTHYDKTIIDVGSLTFQGLFDWFKKELKLDLSMVACGTASLYNAYLPGNRHKDRLNRPIEEVFAEVMKAEWKPKDKYMILVVSGETEDGDDFVVPTIKYIFRK